MSLVGCWTSKAPAPYQLYKSLPSSFFLILQNPVTGSTLRRTGEGPKASPVGTETQEVCSEGSQRTMGGLGAKGEEVCVGVALPVCGIQHLPPWLSLMRKIMRIPLWGVLRLRCRMDLNMVARKESFRLSQAVNMDHGKQCPGSLTQVFRSLS